MGRGHSQQKRSILAETLMLKSLSWNKDSFSIHPVIYSTFQPSDLAMVFWHNIVCPFPDILHIKKSYELLGHSRYQEMQEST